MIMSSGKARFEMFRHGCRVLQASDFPLGESHRYVWVGKVSGGATWILIEAGKRNGGRDTI